MVGGGGGGGTTIMRPRGLDQERGGLTTYYTAWYLPLSFRFSGPSLHAGKGTGHAEPAS